MVPDPRSKLSSGVSSLVFQCMALGHSSKGSGVVEYHFIETAFCGVVELSSKLCAPFHLLTTLIPAASIHLDS